MTRRSKRKASKKAKSTSTASKAKARKAASPGSRRRPSRWRRLSSVFELDLRGLAAMRVGLGLLVVLDVINRAFSFTAHYTDGGVLTRAAYFDEFETKWHISLHLLTSAEPLIALLFALAAVFGIMLALGYKTRVATIGSWLLMISLHSRNALVLQGGDEIFRMLLFWSIFLPLGARFSLDRALSADHQEPPTAPVMSMATVCLVGQVVFLYAFASASKMSHPVWWSDGLGVYFALSVEQFTTRFGLWVRDFTTLLVVLNYATLVLQALVPIALLVPLGRDRIRAGLAISMIGLHLGFAASMQLGLFSYIVAAMWLAFLPPAVWDTLERRLPDLGPRARRLRLRLRERLGRGDPTPGPAPSVAHVSAPAAKAILATLLVYVLWWNLSTANKDFLRMPESFTPLGEVLRFDQRFQMFSNPPRWTQWFIIVGAHGDGRESVDVLTGKRPSFDKPSLVSDTFESQRWRKYMNNLARPGGKPHRKHFAAYMCRRWNAEHDESEAIGRIDLVMMRQATPPEPGGLRLPADEAVLGQWECP